MTTLVSCAGFRFSVVPGEGIRINYCIDSTSEHYAKVKGGLDKIKLGSLVDGASSFIHCK